MTNPNPTPGTDIEPVTPAAPEPQPTPTPQTPPPPAPPAEPDYKTKFTESARENEVLRGKLADLEKRNKPLTTDPTEQELREMYPGWDDLDENAKRFARNNLKQIRLGEYNAKEIADMRAEQAWQSDLKNVVKTFPDLKGHEAEFEEFVFKPTRRGVPIPDLARAFLYDVNKATPPTPPTPPPAPEGGLEPGGTGRIERPKAKELTAAELETLRKTDNKAYLEYVKTHEVNLDI